MKNKIKKKMTGNKKNIAKISSGTLLGQFLAIITLPIITRIYGPEVIGIWTILNSIATVINSFSDLGMSNSIMVEDEKDIESTYNVITSIVAVVSIVSSFFVVFYYIIFGGLENLNSVFLFMMITLIIFLSQQVQICYTWLNRKGEYNVLMKNPMIQQGSYSVIAIILGLLGMNIYGYFIGQIFGSLITLIHMKSKLPRKFFTINVLEFKNTILRNNKFIKFQMPSRILNNFQNQLPILLIQGLWGTEVLGYFSMTIRILQIPSTLLATAIGRVFFQTTSSLKKSGASIGQYVYRNLSKGMMISFIPMTFLMAFGDVIAIVFLGIEWKIAGDFIRIMTLQYYFMFLMNTVLGLDIILEKQHYKMVTSFFQILGFITGAFLGRYYFSNIYIGLVIMSLFYIIIQIGYFSTLFKVMNTSVKKYLTGAIVSTVGIITLSLLVRMVFDYFEIIERLYNIIGL